MHVAALIGRLRQNLAQRCPQAGVSSVTTNSTPCRPRAFSPSKKSRQLDRLSRLASSTASTWRRPSQSIPIAISTAWLVITPASRTRS
jgi:hypothetical protein